MAKHNSISKSQSKAKILAFPVDLCPRCGGIMAFFVKDSELQRCIKCSFVLYPRHMIDSFLAAHIVMNGKIPEYLRLESHTSEKVSVVGIQSFTAKRKATK
jgi:hypothetical protein